MAISHKKCRPPPDFKRALHNFMKVIHTVLAKHFDNTLVDIASMLHELASALLLNAAGDANADCLDKLLGEFRHR